MEMSRQLLILHQILFCVSFKAATGERRPKRVINGETLGDREKPGYASPQYYVWIGTGPDKGQSDEWKYDQQACGGALLTPSIVQSACNCFCDWHARRQNGEELAYRNKHSFEVVIGCSEWKEKSPCTPKSIAKYMIHPMCRKVWGWISHDYAIFTLKIPVELMPLVKPAPVYELEEMATMWARFVTKTGVCMIMGFGAYESGTTDTKSQVLRHGWQAIREYMECYDEYTLQSASPQKANLSAYQEFATWSCMKPFGKKLTSGKEELVGNGDFGSPITCNNIYFGVISQTGQTSTAKHTNTNDLIFYAYANSLYYRDIMVQEMLDPRKEFCHIEYVIAPDRLICSEKAPRNFHAVVETGTAHVIRSSKKAYYVCASFLIMITVYY